MSHIDPLDPVSLSVWQFEHTDPTHSGIWIYAEKYRGEEVRILGML